MVKDTTNTVKKKRKTTNTDTESEHIDLYKKVCEFEEKEAQNRNSEADTALFFNIYQQIQDLLEQVRELKQSGEENLSERINCLTEIVVKVCLIKKLNRIDKLTHVTDREILNTEKQKCDSIKLTYQNLVYELHHLVTETNKCLSFKSEDEDIELVPFEDFMQDAPASITEKFKNFDSNNPEDEHALRLARLEWELTQRVNLAEECKALEEKKKKVVEEITERKEKLNDLLPLLNMVIKATKPLQEHLGMSSELTRKEHKLANLLPDPLYVFYANIVAYKSVFETNLNVVILGDKDEAIQFNEAEEVSHSSNINEDDSEPESDLPEVEEIVEVKKRRHRKSVQQIDPMEEKKKKLLEVHPLSVELSITAENDGPTLNIIFKYYTKIKIITVNSSIDISSKLTANTARDILSGHNILSELIANDTGLESPNPSTGYQLKKLGIGSYQKLIPDIGYAYSWAQSVCGIDFLASKKSCDKLSQQHVENVLEIINKRLNTRTHLAKQLQQLEQNILPPIPEKVEIPRSAVSYLSKWASTTYMEFCLSGFTKHLVDENIVTSSDLYYFAKILRGKAELHVFVALKNTYPVPPPIFALSLIYKSKYSSTNCDDIRDLERTLNVDWDFGEQSSSWLLSAQLTHLCAYLDVYLETTYPKEFQSNTKFIRSISGRNQKKPFRFRNIGTGIFTQY